MLDDLYSFTAGSNDCGFRVFCLADFMLEEVRGYERIVACYSPVFGGGLVPDRGVWNEELARERLLANYMLERTW